MNKISKQKNQQCLTMFPGEGHKVVSVNRVLGLLGYL